MLRFFTSFPTILQDQNESTNEIPLPQRPGRTPPGHDIGAIGSIWYKANAHLKIASVGTRLRLHLDSDNGISRIPFNGNEGQAFGVLLDAVVDTATLFDDGMVTGSIARACSSKGQALRVAAGTDVAKLTPVLAAERHLC